MKTLFRVLDSRRCQEMTEIVMPRMIKSLEL